MYKILPRTIQPSHSIEVEFQIQSERYSIFFRSEDIPLSGNLEAYLAAILLPCMNTGGGTITAEGEISQRLLTNLPTIQDIYRTWLPELSRATVEKVRPMERTSSIQKRVGAFFSAGIDSFYTFFKHKDEITDLIFIHGLETHLDNLSFRKRISANVCKVAAQFGKNVIEIEMNVREMLDCYLPFGRWGYGIGLMIAGHLLHPALQRIYVPSSFSYAHIVPHGSHPILDPLWSTEAFEIVHDGCEASRLTKMKAIVDHDMVMETLHVCHSNAEGVYNCGRCEKCVRTMVGLQVAGALERCTAFDIPFDIRNVRNMNPLGESFTYSLPESLAALKQSGKDPKLTKALQSVLNRPLWLRKLGVRMEKYKRALARRFPGYKVD